MAEVRTYPDANALIEAHVGEIDVATGSDVDDMVKVALMTAAFILYAQNDGDIEKSITDLQRGVRKAVALMDQPGFKQPH